MWLEGCFGKVRLNREEKKEKQRRRDEQVLKKQTNRNRDRTVTGGQKHEVTVTDEVGSPSFIFSVVTKP